MVHFVGVAKSGGWPHPFKALWPERSILVRCCFFKKEGNLSLELVARKKMATNRRTWKRETESTALKVLSLNVWLVYHYGRE